jgi:hypothetical protein
MGDITRRGLVKGAALAPLALPLRSMAQQPAGGERFDIVVAGAGHNSLVCSAYLAKAGPFLRLAGAISGPKDLSTRKVFSKK